MHANISNALRYKIYRRDGFRCALCDCTRGLQIHHMLERGRGGKACEYNLITLCSYCHSHIHGRPLYDTPMTAEDVQQAALEYLCDFYAGDDAFERYMLDTYAVPP